MKLMLGLLITLGLIFLGILPWIIKTTIICTPLNITFLVVGIIGHIITLAVFIAEFIHVGKGGDDE